MAKSKGLKEAKIMPMDKSLSIDKITNGYTIRQYTNTGKKEIYVKDLKTMPKIIKKMMK